MKKEQCIACGRPIGNSLSTIDGRPIHKRCIDSTPPDMNPQHEHMYKLDRDGQPMPCFCGKKFSPHPQQHNDLCQHGAAPGKCGSTVCGHFFNGESIEREKRYFASLSTDHPDEKHEHTAEEIISGRSFSEFFTTASDEDKKALYDIAIQEANKEQREMMENNEKHEHKPLKEHGYGWLCECGEYMPSPQTMPHPDVADWEKKIRYLYQARSDGKVIVRSGLGEIFLDDIITIFKQVLQAQKEEVHKRLVEELEFQTWKISDDADIYEVRTHLRHWLDQELAALTTLDKTDSL